MSIHSIGKTMRQLAGALLMSGTAITVAQAASSPPRTAASLADLTIEQLMEIPVDTVYGASKYEQKVTEAPSSISIITADEIKKFGWRTLADVLRSVRGVYVPDDRNYAYLGIRGFLQPGDYNTRFLVLVDGHRMNDNVYDSAYVGQDSVIDVDLIERVEVIRGPSSSIYGSSAFFGVINVITKHASRVDGIEVSVEAASFDTYKERFSFGTTFSNDVEWLLSGSRYTSEGQDRLYYPEFDQRIGSDPRATHNGVAENQDGEEAHSLFTSLRYQDFTLSGAFAARNKEVPTASFGTIFNDGREETTDGRGYVDLKYDHRFSDELGMLGRVFYDNYHYHGTYPTDYASPGDPPDIVLNKDDVAGEWGGTEWQLTAKLFERHTLVVGTEYRKNIRQYQANYDDVQPRYYYLDDDHSTQILGLFAQDEMVIMTNLSFTAGLRYDYYFESFGGTANPRMGLIYRPWTNTTFKALYGQAFRAPNPYELYYYRSTQQSRPELKPETIRTYELIAEQYIGRHTLLTVSGYRYEVEDLISQAATPAGDPYYANLDNASAHGIEFGAQAKFVSGLLARASYALQRTEDGTTGMELSNSPRHVAKLNLSLPLYRNTLFISPELQYLGATRTIAGNRADDFLVANVTLFSQHIIKDLEVSASVYNLFDTTYGYPGAEDHLQDVIEQDGRSVRVKATYRF